MNHRFKYSIFIIIFGLFNPFTIDYSEGKTLCVSNNGNDNNSGTDINPLKNIQTALMRGADGDTIKVAGGIYNEGLIPQSKLTILGGYTDTFLDSERDIFVNKAIIQAVSTNMLTDNYGCIIDGFIFDGNNVANKGLVLRNASTVTHNIIFEVKKSGGMAIEILDNSNVINNTIHNNTYGVYISRGDQSVVKNNIITNNGFGIDNLEADGIHKHNDVFNNSFNYVGFYNWPGIGDISLNPLYRDVSALDFRVENTSPTIDMGDPGDLVGDEPEPNGGRIDMGAYGGTKNATSKLALNTPPNPPQLVSPSEDAFINDTQPQFVFNIPTDPNEDELHFKIEITQDSEFVDNIITYESLVNSSGFNPVPPVTQGTGQIIYSVQTELSDGIWWWRVSAWDGQEYGEPSESHSFSIDTQGPYSIGHDPVKNATQVARNTNISLHVKDDLSGVDQTTITMQVNGETIVPTISGDSKDYTITYDTFSDFDYDQTITITVEAQDNVGNVMETDTYSFTTMSEPSATDYYVDRNTPNPPGSGTINDPWVTISYALGNITGEGYTVNVAAGTYDTDPSKSVNGWVEQFPLMIKNGVSVVGAGYDVTIIDANETNKVIWCENITDNTTTIKGFTLQNGTGGIHISSASPIIEENLIIDNNSSDVHNAGGISVVGSYEIQATPIIRNNVIKNNSAGTWGGGGINIKYYYTIGSVISDNIIEGNNAGTWGGGGIRLDGTLVTVINNVIIRNTASESTGCGGIYVQNHSTSGTLINRIENNVIAKNIGGGIRCEEKRDSNIFNNTIAENTGSGITIESDTNPVIKNNIIAFNSKYGVVENEAKSDPSEADYNIFYNNALGAYLDEGQSAYTNVTILNAYIPECNNNIEGNPYFVDLDNDDYHLQPGSIAIDAGDPSSDFSNEPEPNGGRINLGAYGNTSEATSSTGDNIGPLTIDISALPNPTEGNNAVTLTAVISDSGRGTSSINQAEYFIDQIGSNGNGSSMNATDGSFDSPSEAVQATIDISSWATGSSHVLYVHGQDIHNNWGDVNSISIEVTGQKNSLPGVPNPQSPINNSIVDTFTPTFSWSIPNDVNNDSLHFKVELDDDINFEDEIAYIIESMLVTDGFTPALPVQQGSGIQHFTMQSNLPSGDWWWRVSARDEKGYGDYSDILKFTIADSPTASTDTATDVSTTSATLNGIVNPNGLNTTVKFEYGLTTGYGNELSATQSPVSGISLVNVSVPIEGLTSNTTYHYRVVAVNNMNTAHGCDFTFKTLEIGNAPTVTTTSANDVTSNSATLNGLVNANGLNTTVRFEYGLTTDYGNIVTAIQSPVSGTTATSVNVLLTDLFSNTTYYFRVVATNNMGTTYGDDQTFTTLQSGSAPTVTTISATSVGPTSAILNGMVNPNGLSTAVRFEYGTSTAYGSEVVTTQSPVTGTNVVSVSAPLTDLNPSTPYNYRVVATSSIGTTYGEDQSFTTLAVLDNQAPTITHSSTTSTEIKMDITISTNVADDVNLSEVRLYYRQGGESNFASTPMSHINGNVYQGTIPDYVVTDRGVEYYIEAQDSSGNTSFDPPVTPTITPHVVHVTFSELICPNATLDERYRMISVPAILQSITPEGVLEDDFGTYNKKQWRLFRLQSGEYKEYTKNSIDSFTPGNAFWLITKESDTWDVESGQSITTKENYQIPLQPGWNQIGNPFAFPVAWADVLKSEDIESRLVGYNGDTNGTEGYDYSCLNLYPWEGYFVKNLSDQERIIEIPPTEAPAQLVKQNTNPLEQYDFQEGEWGIQIFVSCEEYLDKDNYIGCLQDAENGWDRHDFSEVPIIDNHVSLYFPHEDWEKYPGHYTGDFRSISSEGQNWDFNIRTNITNANVEIKLSETVDLPSGWNIYITDKTTRETMDFTSLISYTFQSENNETLREFRIMIGREDFIADNQFDFSGLPNEIELLQNYPNPFNSETNIGYVLPYAGWVKIVVFNVNGQKIQTLVDDYQSPGRHYVTWNGRNVRNIAMPSGIYFIHTEMENYMAIRKIILTN